MKRRSMWSWGILTLFVLLPAVFIANLAGPEGVARGKMASRPLTDEMTREQQIAQDAALADPRVQGYTTGYRTEVFGVQTVGHQYTAAASECATADCRQVNIYNFDKAETVTVLVNVENEKVLDVLHQPGIRPGLPARLAERALEIATNAPEVIEVLGYKPENADWAPMDSTLVGSDCERGHVCVAPSFDTGDYIVWAIVDLTDDKFVDLFWTSAPADEDEGERAQPYPYAPQGCIATPGNVTRDGWGVSWETTANDGFRVYNVTYNGTPVITSAKLVEWHADYGNSGYQDSTGCSGGGGGFPIYPFGNTQQLTLQDSSGRTLGFELVQDFRMGSWGNGCNYRYEQHFQFFTDGRYRVVAGAYGKGCGQNSLYRPIMRIDVAAGGGDANDSFDVWSGGAWTDQATEIRLGPNGATSPEGYAWRVMDEATGSGYYIEPGRGQYGDRGDNEFIYAVQHKPAEGDTDLGVFGAGCCNDNNHGPEIYVNGETIADNNLVLWYVPQKQTDAVAPDYYCWTVTTSETYPCFAGPMFNPIVPITLNDNGTGMVATGANLTFNYNGNAAAGATYAWDFGDGNASTAANPSHTYAAQGSYTVTVVVTSGARTYTFTKALTVIDPTQAGFTHNGPVSVGTPVQFTNTTTGGGTVAYLWDFGDGSATSTMQNPTHSYTAPGSYTVTLTAMNEVSTDTFTATVQVQAPTAVTVSHMAADHGGLPTMMLLWAVGGLLAMGIAVSRIAAMRR